MKNLRRILTFFYPFIIGLASCISLYQQNYFEISFQKVARTLLVISALTLITFLLHLLIFRKADSARIVTSLIVFSLVNFGSMDALLSPVLLLAADSTRLGFIIVLLILALFFTVWIISKYTSIRKNIDWFLSFAALALTVIFILNFGKIILLSSSKTSSVSDAESAEPRLVSGRTYPDIYFIVLDSYASSDTLQNSFDFDNSDFTSQLTDLGFFIPEKSYSNYDGTALSISSVFNMEYVQSFTNPDEYDPDHRITVDKSINNKVRTLLKQQGYKTTAFISEYPWLLWRDADHFLEPKKQDFLTAGMNQFEFLVLKKSIFDIAYVNNPRIFDDFSYWIGKIGQDKYEEQLYVISHLSEVPEDGSPKFVYAHITITHTPYLFHSDGSMIDAADQGTYRSDFSAENIRASYLETIRFTNSRLIPELKEIINANPNVIIIVQGDHGYPGKDQNAIFFAIYDPLDSLNHQPCYTPINLFPSIFNTWLGTAYKLNQNEIYKTTDEAYYRFESLGTCETLP